MSDTNEMLREFVQLSKDEQAAEEALKSIKERRAAMQEPLQEYFLTNGIQNANIDGVTVYLFTTAKTRPKYGKDEVIEALRATGHDELVRVDYHWTQLNALVKGYMQEGVDLPPALADAVEVVDEISLRTRRSST